MARTRFDGGINPGGLSADPTGPKAGDIYYNTTSNRHKMYNGVSWTDIGSGSGGINYITYNDAESSTQGWATYADAAGVSPVDGTGGSPNVTWTTSSSAPLRGLNSYLLTKDAANRQGQGVSYAFTIDAADKSKVLQGYFEYAVSSGTFADNDVSVWIYDVTNSVVIQPAAYQLKNHTLPSDKFFFEFQTSSSSTSYRLIIHVASTSASAYTLKFDNFNVGPQAKLYGSATSEWIQYVPTLNTGARSGTISYDKAFWRRVGSDMEIRWDYKHTAAGTAGSGAYTFTIPSGYTIDTNKTGSPGGGGRAGVPSCGIFNEADSSNQGSGVTTIDSSTTIGAYLDVDANSSAVAWGTTGTGSFGNSSLLFSLTAKVPITGWQSSVIMSDSADTRIIAAGMLGDPASATAGNPIIFPSKFYDTHNAYNTSTGKFTCPLPGYVRMHGFTNGATNNVQLTIYLNNSAAVNVGNTNSNGDATFSGTIKVIAGDQLHLGPSTTYDADGNSQLFFEYIQGPAQIAASETVAFIALPQTATGTLTNSYNTVVLATVNKDTHGSYNTSTGIYTVQTPGYYQISGGVDITGTYTIGQTIGCRIGNTTTSEFHYGFVRAYGSITTDLSPNASGLIYCRAGDQVTLASFVQGSSLSFSTSLTGNYLTLARVSR